jgi:endonuclease/exonuclease/phosphatase family metal-dependent hydrolase
MLRRVTGRDLRVMTFNIWRSGGRSLDRTIDVIRHAEPDVVGLQECNDEAGRAIADALGLHRVQESTNAVLARQSLTRIGRTAHEWGGVGATLVLEDGPLHVFSAHLHWTSYGPYALLDGAKVAAVLEEEHRTRMPGLEELLSLVSPRIVRAEATVLLGDFNAPSHLDYPGVDWPVSVACERAGLRDSYRVVHPRVGSPEGQARGARPDFGFDDRGITWTPLVSEEPRGAFDRIDFVTYGGASDLVPTTCETLDSRNSVADWPSDHRAVLATFAFAR